MKKLGFSDIKNLFHFLCNKRTTALFLLAKGNQKVSVPIKDHEIQTTLIIIAQAKRL